MKMITFYALTSKDVCFVLNQSKAMIGSWGGSAASDTAAHINPGFTVEIGIELMEIIVVSTCTMEFHVL